MVELLVVISIIAILSSIAISIYSTVGAKARDGKRRADIDEFRKALELNYDEKENIYPAPVGNMFSAGFIPQDPTVSSSYKFKSTTYGSGNLSALPGSGSFPDYEICALLEITGSGNSNADGNPQFNGPLYCHHNAR